MEYDFYFSCFLTPNTHRHTDTQTDTQTHTHRHRHTHTHTHIYLHMLCVDDGCSFGSLLKGMNREREKHVDSMTS